MLDTLDCKLYTGYEQIIRICNGVNSMIESRNIYRHTKKLHPPKENPCKYKKERITASLCDKGIQEFAVGYDRYPLNDEETKFSYHNYVRMTIKPAVFLYPHDPYALSQADDVERVERELNRFINELNHYIGDSLLPPIIKWKITRVDYAYQFQSPNYWYYLLLFKKERPEKNSAVYFGNTKTFPSEIRYWNKNICFHVYDKTTHLLENYGVSIDEAHYDNHELRFEVQCMYPCLSSIVYENEMKSSSIRTLWNQDIAQMKVRNAINKVIGTCDFYDRYTAKRILSQHYSDGKVQDMLAFLAPGVYSKTKGKILPKLYAKHFGNKEEHVKKNFLPYFQKAGVNIRLLPNKWGIVHLENPINILGLGKK